MVKIDEHSYIVRFIGFVGEMHCVFSMLESGRGSLNERDALDQLEQIKSIMQTMIEEEL